MRIFLPNYYKRRVTNITLDDLSAWGVRALFLDVDNTLSTHHGQKPVEGLVEWLAVMKANGVRLLVLSNSKKKRVEPFAQKLGLDFISLSCKPLPFGFWRGLHRLDLKRRQVALVGDQLFTDVLGGRLCGVKTVRVEPILLEDKKSFIIRRKLEAKILKNHVKEQEYGC